MWDPNSHEFELTLNVSKILRFWTCHFIKSLQISKCQYQFNDNKLSLDSNIFVVYLSHIFSFFIELMNNWPENWNDNRNDHKAKCIPTTIS